MRSPCCNAAVEVRVKRDRVHAAFDTRWYACTACGQPCEPVEKEGGK